VLISGVFDPLSFSIEAEIKKAGISAGSEGLVNPSSMKEIV
jgi:hypothetical protein